MLRDDMDLLESLDVQDQRILVDMLLRHRSAMRKTNKLIERAKVQSKIKALKALRFDRLSNTRDRKQEMAVARAVLVECVYAQQVALDNMVRTIKSLSNCNVPSAVSRNRRSLGIFCVV